MKYSTSFVVSALSETWNSLLGYSTSVSEEEWDRPSNCPNWTVRDVLAHIIGTELSLLGEASPDEPEAFGDHVKNDVGKMNERWVTFLRTEPITRLIDRFEHVIEMRLKYLNGLDEESFNAPSWTPVGEGTYRDFMEIRVMDCFVHEQDIRVSTGSDFIYHDRSGAISLDKLTSGLGFVIGKKAKAPDGSQVTFEIAISPNNVTSTTLLVDGGRATIVREVDHSRDTAIIKMPIDAFVFATAGRSNAFSYLERGEVTFEGNLILGRLIFEHLGFII
ncbi:MAG: maleylpyruvate isomerase family mycothiol-dependent enzyme [Actinomycetota bacterium]|nr:maleylpyruvate isomerase family mycothiol-dependent enzyme [Actinomycetota bacterium]